MSEASYRLRAVPGDRAQTLPQLINLKELAARLKLTREALGWSQVEICNLTGISPQVWNNAETGDNVLSLTSAVRLSQKTGLPLDWIYFGRLDASAPTEFRKALFERQRAKRRS